MSGLAPVLELNDGASIPQLGMGVMYIPAGDLPALLADAVTLGFRHFDTATHYGNEAGIGEGIRRLDLSREELFVATKLPNAAHGYDAALRAFDRSEQAIGHIDLYLLHWPQPPKGKYLETWRAMVRLRGEGRVRSIGVCNFPAPLLDELIADTGVAPAVNQIELHPAYPQPATRAANQARGILTESWSPLEHGRAITHPTITAIADIHGCSPAAVVLRWHLDLGLVVIPKAATPAHLASNFAALEIVLSAEDHAAIAALARADGGFGPDPMVHTTEQGAE
ncbi:aldo/keto reductase [Glaciibacter sp. 2TAF33]|uniref:aldo/keto reductase n=1 Tax=Glaciibacter sp. 2TAF33 TaxID=3233015 RepID=UPI003F933B6C